MVAGARCDAEALWDEVGAVLAPMGLRLSEEKTRVCHIDEGFDFLGWRIQRRDRRGRSGKQAVYTYPSKKALASVVDKVRSLTRRRSHRTLAVPVFVPPQTLCDRRGEGGLLGGNPQVHVAVMALTR